MDGDAERFARRIEQLSHQIAEASVAAEWRTRDTTKPLHYSDIEQMAHRMAQQVSREIQERAAREVAAEAPSTAACPGCGVSCVLQIDQRLVQSIDGEVKLAEPKGHCNRCRRSFFPSAGSVGAGQPGSDADATAANHVRRRGDAIE